LLVHPIKNTFKGRCYRPETVGEGKYRLFVSEGLQKSDNDLAKLSSRRISDATSEISAAAIQLAQMAQAGVRDRKRAVTDASHEHPTGTVREVCPMTQTANFEISPCCVSASSLWIEV
jgi:hypothetical protein